MGNNNNAKARLKGLNLLIYLILCLPIYSFAGYSDSVDKNGCWDALKPGELGGACLHKISTPWLSESKFKVVWGNQCTHRIYAKYCNERTTGAWDCGAGGIWPGKKKVWVTDRATGEHFAIAIGSDRPMKDASCPSKVPYWYDEASKILAILKKLNGIEGETIAETIAPKTKGSWVHFFHRGIGSKGNDHGFKGNIIKVSVDRRYVTHTTPLASTSFFGVPPAKCDESVALPLPPGKHYYSSRLMSAKFELSKGECKAIEITNSNFGIIK